MTEVSPLREVSAFCPRCDREFKATLRREAIRKMDAHVKKAHPDYHEALKA